LGIGPALITVATAGGLGQILVPLADGAWTVPFLIAANVLFSFFVLNYFVTAVSLVQAVTPDHLLGRANASRRFVVQSMIPLGLLVGGILGTLIGLRPAIAIGAVGSAIAVLPLAFSSLRKIRTTDQALELVQPFNERFLAPVAVR
jgi:TRAP-type mannitol/chloroaromatic compound transport system permease large subunit